MLDMKSITSLNKDDIISHSIGTYDSRNITTKFCYNVALGGPTQTANGDVYVQCSFRHNIYRYRVLLRYESIEQKTIKGTSIKVPSTGGLTDISISREKLQLSDTVVDLIGMDQTSSASQESSFLYDSINFKDDQFTIDKISSSNRYVMNKEGPCSISDSDLGDILKSIQDNINTLQKNDDNADNNDGDDDDNDEEEQSIITMYAGNMIIDAPSVISNEEASISLTWIIRNYGIYRSTISFEAYQDSKSKPTKGVVVQPILKDFYIDELITC
jgi:hypothetical protein